MSGPDNAEAPVQYWRAKIPRIFVRQYHYRDVWDVDDTYYLACRPNGTHSCYLEANVKNGVVTRLGPSMNYGDATDLHGTEVSDRWDPRVCQKGLAMIERFYRPDDSRAAR